MPPDQDSCKRWKTYGKSAVTGKIIRPKLYRCHTNIKQRTTNPNDHNWRYYGARGIKMCEEWHDYANFREWAISNGFKKGLVIDRIDSDGDYCPENCRWIASEDNQPQRKLSHDDIRTIRSSGETAKELSRRFGVHAGHIYNIRLGHRWKDIV